MTAVTSNGYRDAMTSAVVRPRSRVENVRADAMRAAERAAAHTDAEPSSLISETISWALGERDYAPFSRAHTPQTHPSDIVREIDRCRLFLQTTPWSEDADRQIGCAQRISDLLEWLVGKTDVPPTYCRETGPGDLVGGRGRIVRSDAEVREQLTLAQAKLVSGQTSYALDTDWHEGVIATFQWVFGDCALTPILGHLASEQPSGGQIFIEKGEAEEHLANPRARPEVPYHYADAVACSCRWLLGGTTRTPVSPEGHI